LDLAPLQVCQPEEASAAFGMFTRKVITGRAPNGAPLSLKLSVTPGSNQILDNLDLVHMSVLPDLTMSNLAPFHRNDFVRDLPSTLQNWRPDGSIPLLKWYGLSPGSHSEWFGMTQREKLHDLRFLEAWSCGLLYIRDRPPRFLRSYFDRFNGVYSLTVRPTAWVLRWLASYAIRKPYSAVTIWALPLKVVAKISPRSLSDLVGWCDWCFPYHKENTSDRREQGYLDFASMDSDEILRYFKLDLGNRESNSQQDNLADYVDDYDSELDSEL